MGRRELPPPPIMPTLGMAGSRWPTAGRLRAQAEEYHYNPLGAVHGGVISTLLDTCTGCAVHTTLPAGRGYTSLDLTAKFLRPATVDSGLLRCEGTVINRGRRTALAEARPSTRPAGSSRTPPRPACCSLSPADPLRREPGGAACGGTAPPWMLRRCPSYTENVKKGTFLNFTRLSL